MGWLSKLFVGGSKSPIEAVFDGFDSLVTSDEERAAADLLKLRAMQDPGKLQVQLNMVEAGHRSIFVAGWRPMIGWVCAISLGIFYIPQYTMATYLWVKLVLATGEMQAYPATSDAIMEMVLAMLGMAVIRTVEKMTGKAK